MGDQDPAGIEQAVGDVATDGRGDDDLAQAAAFDGDEVLDEVLLLRGEATDHRCVDVALGGLEDWGSPEPARALWGDGPEQQLSPQAGQERKAFGEGGFFAPGPHLFENRKIGGIGSQQVVEALADAPSVGGRFSVELERVQAAELELRLFGDVFRGFDQPRAGS